MKGHSSCMGHGHWTWPIASPGMGVGQYRLLLCFDIAVYMRLLLAGHGCDGTDDTARSLRS